MKTKKTESKSIRYLLHNYNGTQLYLFVPSTASKAQKCYIEYNNDGQKKYYGKGVVKKKADQFFNDNPLSSLTKSGIESMLYEIFKGDIEIIISELEPKSIELNITMRSKVIEALKSFYQYKQLQHLEGTVDKVSMYGYKHHQQKLVNYFTLSKFNRLTLIDLNSNHWLNYRIDLLNNTYGISTKHLKNSSVNQHFQYITQFYTWLIDYNEFPIKNHLKKLKRLSEASHDKRFKVIPDNQFYEFYEILETKEKYRYTRLYLAGLLLYENNIRLSEQALIRVADLDLTENIIRVMNKKNDSIRTVIISSKAKELITIIFNNTISKGFNITDDLYLYGGYNRLKAGLPLSHKEIGILMREFRIKYPQFKGRTLYEHKHTSITNQFNGGVEHYQIKERANHSSISTTEIYLQANRIVKPYELKMPHRPDNNLDEL